MPHSKPTAGFFWNKGAKYWCHHMEVAVLTLDLHAGHLWCPLLSLTWELRLASICICWILVVASLDLRMRSLNLIISVINPALDKYFPSDLGVILTAEPGRYYVASAFTVEVNIIAKKLVLKEQTDSDDEEESGEKTFIYYVNNGVYGSFNCILYYYVHMKSLLQKRPNQMRSIIHPASGGQHVTVPQPKWGTGSSLKTWVLTPLLLLLLSMDSRGRLFTMCC